MKRGDMVMVNGNRKNTLTGICMILDFTASGKIAIVSDEHGNEEYVELENISPLDDGTECLSASYNEADKRRIDVGNILHIKRGVTKKAYLKMAFEAGHLDAERGAAPNSTYHSSTQMHKAYQDGYRAGNMYMKILSNAGIL